MKGHAEPRADLSPTRPSKAEPVLADEASLVLTVEEEKMERNLIWKMDLYILPFVVLLYLFSFLDRGESAHVCLTQRTIMSQVLAGY